MASPFASVLMDMGFSKEKVDRALEVTGNQGVEPAMEWLLAHADDLEQQGSQAGLQLGSRQQGSQQVQLGSEQQTPLENIADPPAGTSLPPSCSDTSQSAASNNETGDQQVPPEEAKSLQCDECGKLFKSQGEVEFHAAKTQHTKFSESTEEKKPLSEEEKVQQMKLVEQKLKEKKKEREEKDKQEALEREKNRIRAGKEMVAMKKKLEDEELRKAIEQRKREKEEDRLAREKIRQQIEADKQARKAKQLQQQGQPSPMETSPVTPEPPPKPALKKDYSQTKIQIRMSNGSTLTQTFGVKEQLSAVRLFVEINGSDPQPFTLMTNFPKKVFTEEDYEKPLEVLGLVPSAVLILTRAQVS